MKKLYAYLIKYNVKSDSPSYDIRYFEKPIVPGHYNFNDFSYIRAESQDTYIPEEICECCKGKGKL